MIRRPYGPAAWLVDELDDPAAWAAGLRALAVDGVKEIVPAEATVLVSCDRADHASIGGLLDGVRPGAPAPIVGDVVTIDVTYDGEDLDDVAQVTGLTVEEVIAAHLDGHYTVAFCGFSPGFAYLRGLHPVLHVPRRERPRTLVAAGSVAIAAGYTSVYPSSSPGGWHLLGITSADVWDVTRPNPALLTPGTAVRFRRVG
jgi:KipI family sensor histidine kinase inhibitor